MPVYEVTAPDGKVYEVTAPAGASEQQILAYVQQNTGKLPAKKAYTSDQGFNSRPRGYSGSRSVAQGVVEPFVKVEQNMVADRARLHADLRDTQRPLQRFGKRQVSGWMTGARAIMDSVAAPFAAAGNVLGDVSGGAGLDQRRSVVIVPTPPGQPQQFIYGDGDTVIHTAAPGQRLTVDSKPLFGPQTGTLEAGSAGEQQQWNRGAGQGIVTGLTSFGGGEVSTAKAARTARQAEEMAANGRLLPAHPAPPDIAPLAQASKQEAKLAVKAAKSHVKAAVKVKPQGKPGLVDRVKGGVAGAVRSLKSDAPPPAISAQQAAQAEQQALGILAGRMRAAGKGVGDLVAAPGLTTAENISPGAQGLLTALGRREGSTGEALTAALDQRTATFPRRFESAVQDATNLDRSFIAGDVETQMARARARVKPEYDKFAELGPLTSPEMQGLLQKPHVQSYIPVAMKNAKDLGAPTSDLARYEAIINEGLPTAQRVQANANGFLEDAQAWMASREHTKALRKARGQSLTEFLAGEGLADRGGDIAGMDGHLAHKGVPFKRKLVREGGRGLDDAAVAAWEKGYFPGRESPPSAPELQEAIRQELAGNKRFANDATGQTATIARITDFEDLMNHLGIDPTGKKPAQLAQEVANAQEELRSYERLANEGTASPAPEFGMVDDHVPTSRMLYDIKVALDKDYMARQEAAQLGRTRPEDAARNYAKDQVYHAFTAELERLGNATGHDYTGMVKRGGEAPKLAEAFRTGHSLINGNDVQSLMQRTQDMSDLERRAALGGWVNKKVGDAAALQKTGPDALRLMATQDFAGRVAHMAGKPKAAAVWRTQMNDLLRERQGMRMRPGTNSVTGEVSQANRELNGLEGQGAKVPKSFSDLAGQIGGPHIDAFVKGFQAPYPDAVRNALGRLLIDPAYAKSMLEEVNRLRATAGKKPIASADFSRYLAMAGTGAAAASGYRLNALIGGGEPGRRAPVNGLMG